ncbi:voltage-gated potassium channel [Lachnospiraceae bacterium RM5]|nr:voltage-gated potassium channel [Lachnospiraceae bacterium RM5]
MFSKFQKRIFKMVSVGVIDDRLNQFYDIISIGTLIINLIVSVLATFDSLSGYKDIFNIIIKITVFFFCIDFILRVLSAKCLYKGKNNLKAIISYVFSFSGLVDILSFLPYYLPAFFPGGASAFKMFRVARILRLFRINAYYDSLNVITDVIERKKQQLLSSVFIIMVLMIGSSLCMYGLEHDAQPDVFKNAFSGIWWSVSTLLTVGYGDIYPITFMGRIMGIMISFLGVGMVAIPTGIISAGFVEQYTKIQTMENIGTEETFEFLSIHIHKNDKWIGKKVRDLDIPKILLFVLIERDKKTLVPNGDTKILEGDRIVLSTRKDAKSTDYQLRAITLSKNHPWIGVTLDDIDISRKTVIITVERNGDMISPDNNIKLQASDKIFLYEKKKNAKI